MKTKINQDWQMLKQTLHGGKDKFADNELLNF